MAQTGPPAYAWDWFARQRLLWREARSRLARSATTASARYDRLTSRSDVLRLLRADYPRDAIVRDVVDRVILDLAFLGRTGVPFAALGLTNPSRGQRWWWSNLTGEDLAATQDHRPSRMPEPTQLTLEQINRGYGD